MPHVHDRHSSRFENIARVRPLSALSRTLFSEPLINTPRVTVYAKGASVSTTAHDTRRVNAEVIENQGLHSKLESSPRLTGSRRLECIDSRRRRGPSMDLLSQRDGRETGRGHLGVGLGFIAGILCGVGCPRSCS